MWSVFNYRTTLTFLTLDRQVNNLWDSIVLNKTFSYTISYGSFSILTCMTYWSLLLEIIVSTGWFTFHSKPMRQRSKIISKINQSATDISRIYRSSGHKFSKAFRTYLCLVYVTSIWFGMFLRHKSLLKLGPDLLYISPFYFGFDASL